MGKGRWRCGCVGEELGCELGGARADVVLLDGESALGKRSVSSDVGPDRSRCVIDEVVDLEVCSGGSCCWRICRPRSVERASDVVVKRKLMVKRHTKCTIVGILSHARILE